MPKQSDPRIFLCHATEDKPRVQELYQQLKAAGYRPWLDKYDLVPGQNWWREIKKIISDPYNLVVVCLSEKSTTRRGVVQKEIKRALDVLDEMPEDTIYLIPARLERCQAPERLADLHWVDLFEPDGFENLKRALDFEFGKRRAGQKPEAPPRQVEAERASVSAPPKPKKEREEKKPVITAAPPQPKKAAPTREPFEPEMILIPAGEFLMGSDPSKDKNAKGSEQPQHQLYLPDYYIAKTPVTNVQYARFIKDGGYRQRQFWTEAGWQTKEERSWAQTDYWTSKKWNQADYPVVGVSWYECAAYCRWLAEVTGKPYRLPSEAEWEKAARGEAGRIYPWGNQWDKERCNTEEGGKGGTTPVGAYPNGASPYGLLDMAGNVWEWCATKWKKTYPYNAEEDEWQSDYLEGTNVRVLRGGSWRVNVSYARAANCANPRPGNRNSTYGFRCVWSG